MMKKAPSSSDRIIPRSARPAAGPRPESYLDEEEARRFFAALEGIPVPVYLKSLDFIIRFANQAFKEIRGEVVGKHCFEVFHGRIKPCEDCPAVRTLKTKIPQIVEWSPPGSNRIYQAQNSLVAGPGGAPLVLTLCVDITQRKQTEAALRQSEEKYRLLAKQVPALVFKGYADWSLECVDRKIEVLTGYAKEDFDSRRLKWCDLIPPEDLKYASRIFLEALKGDKSYVREHRIRTKGGDIRWVQCRGQIFCDEQGKVDYISGVTFDITERKRVEDALRQSEEQYRLLVNTIPAVVFKGYADWTLDFFDDKIEELTGYKKEEFDSRRIKWSDLILEEDLEPARRAFVDSLKADRTYVREYRIRDRQGRIIWIQARGQIYLGTDGQIHHVSGVLFDITASRLAAEALRSTRERLHFLLSSSPVIIYSCEPHGDYTTTFISDNVTPQLGYEPREFLETPGFWLRNLHPEDAPGIMAELPRAITQGHHSHEYRFRHQDGTYRWLRDELRLVRDAHGHPLEIVGSLIDITQSKVAEDSLRESEQNLRYLASRLFTAQESERKRVSRELHDELGQALLFLKLQLRTIEQRLQSGNDLDPGEWREVLNYVDVMVEDVRRLSRDLSPAILEDLGLSAALRRMVIEFSKHYTFGKCQARLDEVDDLFGPEEQINIFRIFQESLTNVAKYSHASRVKVEIQRKKRHVSFRVEDNGRGFDVARVLGGEAENRGLGLAAIEERVRMLGGVLNLQSREGTGTRIAFTIPL